MVTLSKNWILFSLLLLACPLEASPIVEASLKGRTQVASLPIKGTIEITHEMSEIVDLSSFKMDGKPFQAYSVREMQIRKGSPLMISIYEFSLPPQKSGLYLMSPIEVKIGGKVYKAPSFSYQVDKEQSDAAKEPGKDQVVFKLEASIDGKQPLYPGERVKFVYKISYDQNIDLSRSELPLIHPDHFKQVGDVHIVDRQETKTLTTQTLTQEVEAAEVGSFSFGPSLIEGYSYVIEKGQKKYVPVLLQSVVAPLKIEVLPFPKEKEPLSFTGGIGKIRLEGFLESPSNVSIGDLLILKVVATGIKNLQDFSFPILQCQPGFSGFFEADELPPVGDVEGEEKIFKVELRPIVAFIDAIPSIEIASFDPTTSTFLTAATKRIPITVREKPLKEGAEAFIWPSFEGIVWPNPPVPFLSQPHFEEEKLVKEEWFKPLFFLCFLFIPFQIYLKRRWKAIAEIRKASSATLFRMAFKAKSRKECFQLSKKAFLKMEEEMPGKKELLQSAFSEIEEAYYGSSPKELEAIKALLQASLTRLSS